MQHSAFALALLASTVRASLVASPLDGYTQMPPLPPARAARSAPPSMNAWLEAQKKRKEAERRQYEELAARAEARKAEQERTAAATAAADAAAMRNPADGFGSMIGGIVNAVASIFSHRSSASLPWSQRESPRDASPGPERDASYEA